MTLPNLPFDHSLAFLRRGYGFISWHCDRLGTDGFSARLLGKRMVCLRGLDAAQLVYQPGLFPREPLMPSFASKLLQDEGSVQTLEGDHHTHRKQLFTEQLDTAGKGSLVEAFTEEFEAARPAWARRSRITIHDEFVQLLGRAVMRWVGLTPDRTRIAELAAMIDYAGSPGPMNWLTHLRRSRTEAWARRIIRESRQAGDQASRISTFAQFQDPGENLLDEATAAVELINILRPVVAVSRFMTFAVMSLEEHPDFRKRISEGDTARAEAFGQEVRRLTPFFPVIGGVAQEPVTWRGHEMSAGTRVLVDLYGTNRDPQLWPAPRAFRPERFLDRPEAADQLVPQGAGGIPTGHRCPGEPLTVDLLTRCIELLCRSDYHLPSQDLSVDLSTIPALPASRAIVEFTG